MTISRVEGNKVGASNKAKLSSQKGNWRSKTQGTRKFNLRER